MPRGRRHNELFNGARQNRSVIHNGLRCSSRVLANRPVGTILVQNSPEDACALSSRP